jgi:NDP-4-keto-2,6-dideoxyhexose 3-C-methyltransferase
LIAEIGDVNPDKHGRVTPGTGIPIVPERDVLARNYDFYVVFPWHFRDFFVTSSQFSGKTLVFPLPKLEIVRAGETTVNDSSIER